MPPTPPDDRTIAIVDDDHGVRESLAMLIAAAGYATRAFATAEALLLHPLESFDCVLIDLRLPGMSGADLQAELTKRAGGLPVIVVRAHGDIASARAALRAGAIDFLEKPIDNDDLLATVAAALDGRAHVQLARAADTRARTLHALLHLPQSFRYATIATLFVNVSIGGVLTPYAAPPVLMVAGQWGWDITYMIQTFGWRAASAVVVNALVVTLLFRTCLAARALDRDQDPRDMPWPVQVINVLLLAGVVVFSHHPPVFLALFLLFLGFTEAYRQYHDRLMLRQGLMVAFFLAALITLGGYQRWWPQEVLAGLNPTTL